MGEGQGDSAGGPVGGVAQLGRPRADRAIAALSPPPGDLDVAFIDFVSETGQRGWAYLEESKIGGGAYAHVELEHGRAHSGVLGSTLEPVMSDRSRRRDDGAPEAGDVSIDLCKDGERLTARGRFDGLAFELICQIDDDGIRATSRPEDLGGWLMVDGVSHRIGRARARTACVSLRPAEGDGAYGCLFVPSSGELISTAAEGWRLAVSRELLSGRTFQSVPIAFELERPGVLVRCEAVSVRRGPRRVGQPNCWAGFCTLRGRRDGKEIRDVGFWTWQSTPESRMFGHLIARANTCARARTSEFLTGRGLRQLQSPSARELLSDARSPDLSLADGDRLLEPIRAIAERGGKGWRGYAIAVCCEAVGGDFSQHLDWLAVSELLHVGSLIVDDVEDNSATRRGGPACHVLYGAPAAINAGTLAYFVALSIIQNTAAPIETKIALYSEYSDLLRLGHIGQGLDIELAEAVPGPRASVRELAHVERCAKRANRLKSGVPSRSGARMGAILGKGDTRQIDALGTIFLEVGEAFQLLDDVLNLTGLPGTPGKRGEDIRNGKLTIPVLRALRRAGPIRRLQMLEALPKAATDEAAVDFLIEEVERTGVLAECKREIFGVAEMAATQLDAVSSDREAKDLIQSLIGHVLGHYY